MAAEFECSVAEVMRRYGCDPPTPLPANRDAWRAFCRVSSCRHHVGMGLPAGPAWADIEAVLTLHDLWTPDTQERLATCFAALIAVESSEREQRT